MIVKIQAYVWDVWSSWVHFMFRLVPSLVYPSIDMKLFQYMENLFQTLVVPHFVAI